MTAGIQNRQSSHIVKQKPREFRSLKKIAGKIRGSGLKTGAVQGENDLSFCHFSDFRGAGEPPGNQKPQP